MAEKEKERGEEVPYPGMNQGVEAYLDEVWSLKWYLMFQPSEKFL